MSISSAYLFRSSPIEGMVFGHSGEMSRWPLLFECRVIILHYQSSSCILVPWRSWFALLGQGSRSDHLTDYDLRAFISVITSSVEYDWGLLWSFIIRDGAAIMGITGSNQCIQIVFQKLNLVLTGLWVSLFNERMKLFIQTLVRLFWDLWYF